MKKHTEPLKRLVITTASTAWLVIIDSLIHDFKHARYHHYQSGVDEKKTPNVYYWEIKDTAHIINGLEKKIRRSLNNLGLAEEKFTIVQKEPRPKKS